MRIFVSSWLLPFRRSKPHTFHWSARTLATSEAHFSDHRYASILLSCLAIGTDAHLADFSSLFGVFDDSEYIQNLVQKLTKMFVRLEDLPPDLTTSAYFSTCNYLANRLLRCAGDFALF